MTLRVYLFGPLQVTWQGQPLPALRRPRLQALWAYLLLLHRHRPAMRDQLAFSFWPDNPEDEARAHLRRHLYLLRRWLPPAPDGGWFIAQMEEVRLNAQAELWVDVWAFEDGLTQGEAELKAAVELASADLLPDLSESWLVLERERLRRSYARALARLVMFSQARGDWPATIQWAQRLVLHDPLNEEAHRLLIALYYASGNRPAALRQFETCRRLLREELGVEPMPDTVALRDLILRTEPLTESWFASHHLIGLDRPLLTPTLNAGRVIAPEGQRTTDDGRRTAVPFVGREAEMQRLLGAWRQAVLRSGNLILVGGEAGVGKTRLLHELAAHVRRSGAPVLWGHCYAFERALPYQPAVEIFQALLPQLALSHLPPLWLAAAAHLIPELRQRRPDLPELAPPRSEQEQSQLAEGLCRCLLGLSYQQPLLVLLEDLHWATESTLTWLHVLARHIHAAPILVVGSYRQEEVGLGHPLRDLIRVLRREGGNAPLLLQPLAGDTVQALVEALSGLGEAAVGPARTLYAESEGNPFFLLELIRHLEETGQLVQRGGRWAGPWIEAIQAGEKPALSLPDSVREAISARLDRLSENARVLLSCAAVAGREFDLAVVRTALDWKEERVLRALEELLERGLVHEQNGPQRRDHAFSHHLVQETVYAGLPRAWREALHRWVGEAMLARYGEAAAGELAYHFERGGARERALTYLKCAGDQAATRYANAEALDYYGRALTLLEARGDDAPSRPLRFDLLTARVGVWELLGRREAQRADLEALQALAQALNDPHRQAQVYARWADFYEEISDHAASARAAQNALMFFQRVGDRRGEAQSLHDLGLAAYRQGDYRAARDTYEQALTLWQEIDDRRGKALTLNHLGNLLRQIGEYATAQAYHEEALALCQALADRIGQAESLRSLGALYLFMGRTTLAQTYYEEGLALCRAIGYRRGEAAHISGLAFAALFQGDYAAALAHQRQASSLYEAVGDQEGWIWLLIGQGLLAWHMGDQARAGQCWEQARGQARQLGLRRLETWAMDYLGNLMREQGDYAAARHTLEEVHHLAWHTGDRRLAASSLHHLGQLAWDEGNPVAAASCWREAAQVRAALGLTALAQASQARLAEALARLHTPPSEEARQVAQAVWAAWQGDLPYSEEEDEVRQGVLALAGAFACLGEAQRAQDCQAQARRLSQSRARHIAEGVTSSGGCPAPGAQETDVRL
jgi:DNA-binding SARP family transcriptional activator